MRDIKFRGKRIDNGEWIYGDLINNPEFRNGLAIGQYNNYSGNSIDTPSYHSYDFFEVYPKSVGQYTGLKDKNGKLIYEGDTVKVEAEYQGNYNIGDEGYSYRMTGEIKYMPSKGFYLYITEKLDLNNDEEIKITNRIGYVTQYLSELIGNIH